MRDMTPRQASRMFLVMGFLFAAAGFIRPDKIHITIIVWAILISTAAILWYMPNDK